MLYIQCCDRNKVLFYSYNKSCFFFIWSETITRKTTRRVETNADQLTNLGSGGVSSTCPTTNVILPMLMRLQLIKTQGYVSGQGGEYWVHNLKNHFSLSICMQINHYHVERQCIYVCLSCDGFKLCELIKNDLIQ